MRRRPPSQRPKPSSEPPPPPSPHHDFDGSSSCRAARRGLLYSSVEIHFPRQGNVIADRQHAEESSNQGVHCEAEGRAVLGYSSLRQMNSSPNCPSRSPPMLPEVPREFTGLAGSDTEGSRNRKALPRAVQPPLDRQNPRAGLRRIQSERLG